MKEENIVKGLLAVITTGLTIYFKALAIPILVLICFMSLDYITGLMTAWASSSLNSRIGIKGIVKKICYLIIVCVAMGADWVIYQGLAQVGIDYTLTYMVSMIATIWLIINELISILENVAKITDKTPPFLKYLLNKLKNTVEKKAGDIDE